MYINDTSASGTLPTNATYWEVMLDPTDVNSATDAANEAASDAIDSTRFQHIKYSDYAEPTDGQMNDTDGVYIGLAITSSETAPTTAISYTWNRLKGDTLYATFDVDPETGILSMTTPTGYDGPEFVLTDNDLEVVI